MGASLRPSRGTRWRRTRLAAERTELAWWRTALTSIAVAGYGSIRSRRVERAVDMGEMIPSSRNEARMLMTFGVLLCLATVGLIAASA